MKKITYLICLIITTSCAKLPTETITLTEVVIAEGKRMHDINSGLLNKMFNAKKEQIDLFIKNEYTPKYLEEFVKRIPTGTNFEEELPSMINSIIPKINSRRDMMQATLEIQRIAIMSKLNQDYLVFEETTIELKYLIESNVKVNEERKKVIEKIKDWSSNKIDLNSIESEIDNFIVKSGDLSNDISDKINKLNTSINSILNK
jgi:hypothetical protein